MSIQVTNVDDPANKVEQPARAATRTRPLDGQGAR
jgi:hypothetical protein